MKSVLNSNAKPQIPPLLVNSKVISDDKAKAHEFNQFFASISASIKTPPDLPQFSYDTDSRLSSVDTSESEILVTLQRLKVKKACGIDKVSNFMLFCH